ncbi:hypothetical protein B5C26_19290 [Photorhabdus luminescens]|uniref:hypothetical protein n=1 Tax=Photorhabdus luminescens TaxID=29488 RepID=UPI000B4CF14D|nr:hypothetical protein [Photorhabdus luminescens]OWO80040.1 hypothetical protein B5C26_19290 [Photorhabdus luminescens]
MLIKLKLSIMKITGFYSCPYSKDVDNIITDILDRGELIEADRYVAKFILDNHSYQIWMFSCGFYSLGPIYTIDDESIDHHLMRRPSIKNIERLYREIYLPFIHEQEKERLRKIESLYKRDNC